MLSNIDDHFSIDYPHELISNSLLFECELTSNSLFVECELISNSLFLECELINNYEYVLLLIGTTDASSVTMTASSLCTMVMELTSEEFLLSCSDFDPKTLGSLSELLVRSLHQVTMTSIT